MPIHANSLACFNGLNIAERNVVVLSTYANSPEPITDRQAMALMGASEKNMVSPRVTELIEDGFLYEVDSVKCEVTGKTVRRCTFTGLVSSA